jgi:hypothetical protein
MTRTKATRPAATTRIVETADVGKKSDAEAPSRGRAALRCGPAFSIPRLRPFQVQPS